MLVPQIITVPSQFGDFEIQQVEFLVEAKDEEPKLPLLPAECWNTKAVDAEAAIRAVRAMCGDGK